MHKHLISVAILSWLATVMACSGGGGGVSRTVTAELIDCSVDGFKLLEAGLQRIPQLFDTAQGSARPDVTVFQPSNPLSWDVELRLDLDQDGLNDATFTGRLSFDTDPSSGIPSGTRAAVVGDFMRDDGLIDGSIVFDFEFVSSTQIRMSGPAFGASAVQTGCAFLFQIQASTPVTWNFRFPSLVPGGLIGTIRAFSGLPAGKGQDDFELGADFEFVATSTIVNATNVEVGQGFDINPSPDFQIDLSTP